MARRKCAICGSRQWRKEPASGLITCSEGHVLQGYRNEVRDVEQLGQHVLRKRAMKSREKKKARASKADPNFYRGDRARFHFFQCQQLILRTQVQNLIKLWHLPDEFETICRDVWALHLALLPSPPPPEPYLFREHIPGGLVRLDTSSTNVKEHQSSDDVAKEDSDVDLPHSRSSSNSSSSDLEEEDEGMAALRREASASPSLSEDEDEDKPHIAWSETPTPTKSQRKRQKIYSSYDAPVNNVAVLMLSCWILRIPIMYMDFVRVIESYDLVYLDPVRLLPATLVRHLTKHAVQALSPHFAPQPLLVHRLVSRLAKLLWREYDVFTPEMNVAPLLWRAVRAFDGTPTLYTLSKRVAKVLNLPLTLHYSLSSALAQKKARDPSWHKFDNIPVEVSIVCAVILVLKLAYGLDGIPRLSKSRDDPVHALPDLSALLGHIKKMQEIESTSMLGVFSVSSDLTALDIRDDQLDEYLDFCEKALLPRDDCMHDHVTVKDYFPLQPSSTSIRDSLSETMRHTALPASVIPPNPPDSVLFPGQSYRMYSSTDILGIVPDDYDIIVHRAASWTGLDEEFVHGVVENLERRLQRWWQGIEQHRNPKVRPKMSSNSMKSTKSDK